MDIHQPDILAIAPDLRRYAAALTGNRQHGDELTVKTIDCAKSLISFIPKDFTLPVWLYSVMHNLTLEFFTELYGEVSHHSILPYILPDDLSSDADEKEFDIKGALAHLSLEQREAILLVTTEQLTYLQVCQVLGFNNAKLIACLDNARGTMCEYIYVDQFEDLQQTQ